MRNKIVLFVTGCLILLLTSCLGSDDDDNSGYILAQNCQISAFVLKHDSIYLANGKTIDSLKFTIDQRNGLIFNIDSLPYGTQLEKVICNITYMSPYSIISNKVYQLGSSEATDWNGTDSLDFSQPVRFVVGSYDGVTTKTYWAQINIHQVQPDSMAWSLFSSKITGIAMSEQKVIAYNYSNTDNYFMYMKPASAGEGYKLYRSATSDVKSWSELTLTGLPTEGLQLAQLTEFNDALYIPSSTGVVYTSMDGQTWSELENTISVKYLLGEIKQGRNQEIALAGIADIDGQLSFAKMSSGQQWETGDKVPSGFPLSGFGNINYEVMYQDYLMVVAGKDSDGQIINTAWSTTNGKSWTLITNSEINSIPKKQGIMLLPYDDKFFLLGGIDANGQASKDIHISSDYGISWHTDTTRVFPADYQARGFSSALVDEEQYIVLFGGKTANNSNELDQIWQGRINRLGFKKQ